MATEVGRSAAEAASGHSAEPEPSCTVSADTASVPNAEWYWSGYAGHFCGSAYCAFHLCTRVGNILVSTVGDYRPPSSGGRRESIGIDRDFETFVFLVRDGEGPEGDIVTLSEIDSDGSRDSRASEAQHYAMCAKWASRDRQRAAFEEYGQVSA